MTPQAVPQTFALTVERTIRAPRARVFEAFVNPEDLKRWSAPEGYDVVDSAVDLRVGGAWHVVMHEPTKGVRHHEAGEYREITPPERLVYTQRWVSEESPVDTLITVEFREVAPGTTHVVMHHEGLPSAESRDLHEQGWGSCFDRLEGMFG